VLSNNNELHVLTLGFRLGFVYGLGLVTCNYAQFIVITKAANVYNKD